MTAEYEDLMRDYAADYLKHIQEVSRTIDIYEIDLEETSAALDNLKGIDYSKDRVSGTGNPQKLADDVVRLMEMREYFEHELETLNSELATCQGLLLKLDAAGYKFESFILRNYYLFNKSYRLIERDLAYSHSSVMELRRRGLVELYKLGLPVPYRLPEHSAI